MERALELTAAARRGPRAGNQNFSEGFWLELVLAGGLAAPAGDVAEGGVGSEGFDTTSRLTMYFSRPRRLNAAHDVIG